MGAPVAGAGPLASQVEERRLIDDTDLVLDETSGCSTLQLPPAAILLSLLIQLTAPPVVYRPASGSAEIPAARGQVERDQRARSRERRGKRARRRCRVHTMRVVAFLRLCPLLFSRCDGRVRSSYLPVREVNFASHCLITGHSTVIFPSASTTLSMLLGECPADAGSAPLLSTAE